MSKIKSVLQNNSYWNGLMIKNSRVIIQIFQRMNIIEKHLFEILGASLI